MKKLKKRLPLIFLGIVILSVINVIYIRITASGYNLLTLPSDKGARIAANYYSCLWIMLAAIAAFIIVVAWMANENKKKAQRRFEREMIRKSAENSLKKH